MGQKDKLMIEGGSLCIWGEWFGRPYDNFHKVKSVRWEECEIIIYFDQDESLYISNPSNITNEDKQLCIGEASKILFAWYYYGKPRTYENLYVRQYTKDTDGTIVRAEGKRRDVKDGDGIVFQPKSENAIYIAN